jgi:hypothetical protein
MSLRAVPDTGAATTVLPLAAIPAGVDLVPSRMNLRAANGTGFATAGTVSFTASIGLGPKVAITAVVTPDLTGAPLIGWRDLKRLGVLSHSFPGLCRDTVVVDALGVSEEEDGGDAYYEEVNRVAAFPPWRRRRRRRCRQ